MKVYSSRYVQGLLLVCGALPPPGLTASLPFWGTQRYPILVIGPQEHSHELLTVLVGHQGQEIASAPLPVRRYVAQEGFDYYLATHLPPTQAVEDFLNEQGFSAIILTLGGTPGEQEALLHLREELAAWLIASPEALQRTLLLFHGPALRFFEENVSLRVRNHILYSPIGRGLSRRAVLPMLSGQGAAYLAAHQRQEEATPCCRVLRRAQGPSFSPPLTEQSRKPVVELLETMAQEASPELTWRAPLSSHEEELAS